jgi:hypothetical protein
MPLKVRSGANRPEPMFWSLICATKRSRRTPRFIVTRFNVQASWTNIPRFAFRYSFERIGVL